MKCQSRVWGSVVVLSVMSLIVPIKIAFADLPAEKADYQRKIDKDIQDIKEKINKVKLDYKAEGDQVNMKIREYEDKIAELKRNADDRMKDLDNKNWDNNKSDLNNKISNVRRDFDEWRLKRSINSYEDKISDLKIKTRDEQNMNKKLDMEEKIKKLEAKNNAAHDKLNDLRLSNGDNWNKIESELDAQLKEIDRDYKEARG